MGTQCEVDSCANANLSIMQKVKTDKSCNMCHTTQHLTILGGGKSNEIGVFQTRTNLEDSIRLDTALKIALRSWTSDGRQKPFWAKSGAFFLRHKFRVHTAQTSLTRGKNSCRTVQYSQLSLNAENSVSNLPALTLFRSAEFRVIRIPPVSSEGKRQKEHVLCLTSDTPGATKHRPRWSIYPCISSMSKIPKSILAAWCSVQN